ncbi:hypothetical protein RHMOL_Rhmol13G0278000 [Rhododendron molle]|uniref:Uncharacterized protein n=1 Tax=Rhododendron molle TaxID=49168 RepID=A0ACC0LCJ2_RHOML|nr:hypothetical protein RHMOL_Rhmol13G0278000 [Rhododendron molle]
MNDFSINDFIYKLKAIKESLNGVGGYAVEVAGLRSRDFIGECCVAVGVCVVHQRSYFFTSQDQNLVQRSSDSCLFGGLNDTALLEEINWQGKDQVWKIHYSITVDCGPLFDISSAERAHEYYYDGMTKEQFKKMQEFLGGWKKPPSKL